MDGAMGNSRLRRALVDPRLFAILAWVVGFAIFVANQGFPTKRSIVLVWIALLILAVGIARPKSTVRAFATTWLPLFSALIAYDLLRGLSDPERSAAHTFPQLDLDLWLGAGQTLSERLQHLLWTPGDPHWWDYAAWGVYQSHFLLPLLVAVLLWGIGHRLANRYLLGIAALSWMALATYALYPAQPPWMVARDGLTGDVARIVQAMWHDVGVDRAARVFTTKHADGSKYSNPVAALPSLHAAFPMFIAMMLRGIDRRLDWLLRGYVLAMAFSLVYAGEHFVFDIVLGWGYAIAVAMLATRFETSSSRSSVAAPIPQVAASGIGGSGFDGTSRRR
jgi:hypothetical protein